MKTELRYGMLCAGALSLCLAGQSAAQQRDPTQARAAELNRAAVVEHGKNSDADRRLAELLKFQSALFLSSLGGSYQHGGFECECCVTKTVAGKGPLQFRVFLESDDMGKDAVGYVSLMQTDCRGVLFYHSGNRVTTVLDCVNAGHLFLLRETGAFFMMNDAVGAKWGANPKKAARAHSSILRRLSTASWRHPNRQVSIDTAVCCGPTALMLPASLLLSASGVPPSATGCRSSP